MANSSPASKQLTVPESYWASWTLHRGLWQGLKADQRAAILAMPILSHPDDRMRAGGRPPVIPTVPELRKLLSPRQAKMSAEGFHEVCRLMQIHFAAGDMFDPDRTPAEIAAHLMRHVLSEASVREYGIGGGDWGFGGYHGTESIRKVGAADHLRWTSLHRIRSFLAIPEGESGVAWERQHRTVGDSWNCLSVFSGRNVTLLAGKILGKLMEMGGPQPLAAVVDGMGDGFRADALPKAINALIQHVLVVLDYDEKAADLRIGLWPALARRLDTGKAPPPPPPTQPTPAGVFHEPFFFSDLKVVMDRLSAAPIPLKKSSNLIEPLAAPAREIAQHCIDLPTWLAGDNAKKDDRIAICIGAAYALDMAEVDGDAVTGGRRSGPALVATKEGRHWLALPPTERVKSILDTLRRRRWGTKHWSPMHWNFWIPTGRLFEDPIEAKLLPLEDGLANAFLQTPTDGEFVEVEKLLNYLSTAHNPLAHGHSGERVMHVAKPGRYGGTTFFRSEADLLVPEAQRELLQFLNTRLIPLGGVAVAKIGRDRRAVSLTPLGRYFLTGKGTLEAVNVPAQAAGRVIVQPNFEITFLGADLAAETRLAAFSERIGKHSGTLFRLTRASVQRAGHLGMSAEDILGTLADISHQPVPANVATEVRGWLAARRHYAIKHTTLLRCPDHETAIHLHGALAKITSLLNDTTLELTGDLTPALRRKLEKAGLFPESEHDEPRRTESDDLDRVLKSLMRRATRTRRRRRR